MTTSHDVVIVGAGPVGLAAAAFFGRQGRDVAVFDQQASLYPLPRAGHIDSEIMRLLQVLGCAPEVERAAVPLREGVFLDRSGHLMLKLPLLLDGRTGWFSDYLLYQPDLDRALQSTIASLPNVQVHRGQRAVAIHPGDGFSQITFEWADAPSAEVRTQSVRGSYVIGADGANSFVRQHIGSPWQDLGFEERWLVLDIKPIDPAMDLPLLPGSAQVCDPERPTSLFRWLGREHVRIEFMLHKHEDAAIQDDADLCWSMVRRWGLTSSNSTFTRRAVYTFASRVAKTWRQGNVFLAGDAAHVMPPFLGQGMCSGLRDVANLAWKLDLVMRGLAGEQLLDTYQAERLPHVLALIETSVAAGKVVCVTDPELADERDAALRAVDAPPLPPPPSLVGGLQPTADPSAPTRAGSLSWQGRITYAGRTGLLTDVFGSGWQVLSAAPGVDRVVPTGLGGVPVRTLRLSLAPLTGPDCAVDLDGDYAAWFAAWDCTYVVVRPDLYVYGTARSEDELQALLNALQRNLLVSVEHVG